MRDRTLAFYGKPRGSLRGPAMRGPDGPVRRWLDGLSTPTRVTMTIMVIAIVVGFIVWG
jgi:hypothetical protein